MNSIRNILVIVDPTAAQHPAIEKGALIAQKFAARMELYVCDTKASREARIAAHVRKHADQPFVVNVKSILEDLAAPLRARGGARPRVAILREQATDVECGDPLHIALIDRSVRTTADLIVKDTHHHSLAKRTFITNTDWQLIRACPVPLLLTKPTAWASSLRVFAAVDPGHVNDKPAVLDNRIMDYAAVMSKRLGGELHLVHVYLPAAIIAAANAGAAPIAMTVSAQELAKEDSQKREMLRDLIVEYRIQDENVHLKVGGPAAGLPQVPVGLLAFAACYAALRDPAEGGCRDLRGRAPGRHHDNGSHLAQRPEACIHRQHR